MTEYLENTSLPEGAMDINRTAGIRLHLWYLYDIDKNLSPAKVRKELLPFNLVKEAWVPQTLGDQVWWFVEFQTNEEKDVFLNSIPDKYKSIKGFIMDEDWLTQKELTHWTKKYKTTWEESMK